MSKSNTSPESEAADQANAFLSALQLLDKGAFPAEAGAALAEVIKAVRETAQKGSITIKLEIVPVPKTEGAQVTITPALAAKTPKLSPKARTFYTDGDGQLHRQDPNQQELSFNVRAPKPKAEAGKPAADRLA